MRAVLAIAAPRHGGKGLHAWGECAVDGEMTGIRLDFLLQLCLKVKRSTKVNLINVVFTLGDPHLLECTQGRQAKVAQSLGPNGPTTAALSALTPFGR